MKASSIALGLILGLALATPALARRHHHHGHWLCAPGKILIVHQGRCVSAESPISPRHRYRRLTRYAEREERPSRARRRVREDVMHGDPIEDRVVDDEPPPPRADTCPAPNAWMPDPIGWPGLWVHNRGFAKITDDTWLLKGM